MKVLSNSEKFQAAPSPALSFGWGWGWGTRWSRSRKTQELHPKFFYPHPYHKKVMTTPHPTVLSLTAQGAAEMP